VRCLRIHHLLGLAAAAALTLLAALNLANAGDTFRQSCIDDTMIVFDASGSMAGNEKLSVAAIVRAAVYQETLSRLMMSERAES
jgi:hypothetical protein